MRDWIEHLIPLYEIAFDAPEATEERSKEQIQWVVNLMTSHPLNPGVHRLSKPTVQITITPYERRGLELLYSAIP